MNTIVLYLIIMLTVHRLIDGVLFFPTTKEEDKLLIKKVKRLKDGGLFIDYSEVKEGSNLETTIKSEEEARPAFYEAITAMGPFALEICEFDQDLLPSIEITEVAFSYQGEENIPGTVISFKKSLKTCSKKIAISTPLKFAEQTTETAAEAELLPDKCEEALMLLIEEATAYINGARLQVKADL